MNPKERVLAQIKHQETDFIPYHLTFDPKSDVEDRLDAYYGGSFWRRLIDNAIQILPLPSSKVNIDLNAEKYWTDAYGNIWRLDLRPHALVESALKNPTLKDYKFPSLEECFDPDWETRAHQFIEQFKEYFLVVQYGFGPYERAWTLRGYENLLMDVSLNRGFFEELIEKIVDHQIAIVKRFLELPIDGVYFSDDWGYQQGVLIGAKRWREIMKPHIARLYQCARDAGKYVLHHSCGSIEEILPDLIEIGLDVYESVQPEAKNSNPYELKRKYGNHLTFWGGLGSQSIIPYGTPDEISAEVAHLCMEMGKNGGYILAPAKEIQPETPTKNAAAIVASFLQQAGVSVTAT